LRAIDRMSGREGALRTLDGLQSFGLTVLLFGLPFSEALKSLGLALATLGFVGRLALGARPWAPSRLTIAALALYFVVAVLSVVVAEPSLRRPGELLTLAMTLLPFVLVADACSRGTRRLLFVMAIVFGTALASVLAYVAHMLGPYQRLVLGSIENAVPAGEYLAAVLVLAVSMMVTELRASVWGPLWAFAAGTSGIALLMTKSRGPLAGAITGLAVSIAMAFRRRVLALAIVLAAALVVAGFVSVNPEARLSKAFAPGGRSLGIRGAVWSMSLEKALERPVLGHGQGTYRLLNVVYSDDYGAFLQMNAHNAWLHTACETGVLGAGMLALFVVLGLAGVVRSCRRTAGLDRGISVGALGGLVALLAASLSSVATDAEPGMLFFSLMALGAAVPPRGGRDEGDQQDGG
jgi:O-antigen ligase